MTQPPRYRTPGLGGKSLAMIAAWTLFALAAPLHMRQEPLTLAMSAIRLHVWLVGTLLGLATSLNWLATVLTNRLHRVFFRAAIVTGCAYLQNLIGDVDEGRHAIDLVGMLLVQSIMFRVTGVPDWVLSGRGIAVASSTKPTQFQIVDLLVWTTGLAILLALSIRFEAPVDGIRYWPVLCLLWLVVPMTATCWTVVGLLPGGSRAQLHWLTAGLLLICGVTIGLGAFESQLLSPRGFRVEFLELYGILFGGFVMSILLFSVAGRFQSPLKQQESNGNKPSMGTDQD